MLAPWCERRFSFGVRKEVVTKLLPSVGTPTVRLGFPEPVITRLTHGVAKVPGMRLDG